MPSFAVIIPIIAAVSFMGLAMCHVYEAYDALHKSRPTAKIEDVTIAQPNPTAEADHGKKTGA